MKMQSNIVKKKKEAFFMHSACSYSPKPLVDYGLSGFVKGSAFRSGHNVGILSLSRSFSLSTTHCCLQAQLVLIIRFALIIALYMFSDSAYRSNQRSNQLNTAGCNMWEASTICVFVCMVVVFFLLLCTYLWQSVRVPLSVHGLISVCSSSHLMCVYIIKLFKRISVHCVLGRKMREILDLKKKSLFNNWLST